MEHKLIAFYEQTLNASEQKEVEQWLEADAENKKIYKETIVIWENAKTNPQYGQLNKQAAWEKLQQQLGAANIAQKKVHRLSSNWWELSAIAASIAAIIVLFVFINQPKPTQFTAQAKHESIELPDNSHITLFSNAELLVAADFNKEKRIVTLKGNAFFDIAKNPQKPFIIHSKDVEVEVLGTSFTIQQNAMFNTVFVHSGKVKATFEGQFVTATAQQKIVKDNTTNQLKLVKMQTNIDEVLKTQLLRVKDVRIDSLAKMMEELYNIDVVATPELNGKKITSTYLIGSEIPEQIIENIALTIGASWSKKNNQYIITK